MAIPHVIQWHEGAPEKLEAGMLIQWEDTDIELIGSVDDGSSVSRNEVLRWAWAIKPHELTWAASMAKRHLAK